MNNLLQHPQFGQIRVEKRGEGFIFCAKDVCDALELTNPSVAIQSLDEDERSKKSLGRQGETWFVTKSGMYALIIRSNKPMARKFREWITSEVLPSLRKYGVYSTDGTLIIFSHFPILFYNY
jgi:prophage antirepressor-like protein